MDRTARLRTHRQTGSAPESATTSMRRVARLLPNYALSLTLAAVCLLLGAALPARSNEFRSFGDFSTSPASDEKIMLKGSQVVTEERQYQREATDSCSYSGFCYAYGMKSDGEFGYSFGFHVSCSGHQKVIEQVTDYKRVQTIQLLSLPDNHTW